MDGWRVVDWRCCCCRCRCCYFFFRVILNETRIDREMAFTNSKISPNDRSQAYFPYNYLISKSVIMWQKQKFNRINGWRAVYVRPRSTLFIWITLSARRWLRRRQQQQHRLCMIYAQYWIWRPGHFTNNVNIGQSINTRREMCVCDLTHWDIQPFYLCTLVGQNILMPLFIFQRQVPNMQSQRSRSEEINKQFKFSSFKRAYFKPIISTKKTKVNNRYEACSTHFNDLIFSWQMIRYRCIQFEISNLCFDIRKLYVVFSAQSNCSAKNGKQNKYPECDVSDCLDTSTIRHQHSIRATYIHIHKRKFYSERTNTSTHRLALAWNPSASIACWANTHTQAHAHTHCQIHPSTVAVT